MFFHKLVYTLVLSLTFSCLNISANEYAHKWLVIAGGSKLGTQPTIPKYFTKNSISVPILNSGDYSNLNPGLTILVPEAYSTKADAQDHSKQLRKEGVESYVKNAGEYTGQGGDRSLFWLEEYEGKTFMALNLSASEQSQLSPETSKPKPLSISEWVEPFDTKDVFGTHVGQTFTAFSYRTGAEYTCTIKSYVWLTRGSPHFGYHQSFTQDKIKPTEPGCGFPVLFAEMNCSGQGADFAMSGKSHPNAIFYRHREIANRTSLLEFVEMQQEYQYFMNEANQEAESRSEELITKITIDQYSADKTYFVVTINAITGQGYNQCGAEDLNITIKGIFEAPDKEGNYRVVFPMQKDFEVINGITDLNHDGVIEVFEEAFYKRRYFRSEDSKSDKQQEISVEFCDCGC